jgi:glycosyltransferase involved in cell wall biosynthesis
MELEAFLRTHVSNLLFIAHPLFEEARPSYWRRYSHGVLTAEGEQAGPRGPTRYFREVIRTVRIAAQAHDSFHVFIGADSLLTLAGLWLRRRRTVHKVVLYSIDFVPRRFGNRLLNGVYHRVDRFAAGHADLSWGVSEAIFRARQERDGLAATRPQVVVPVGAHVERIKRLPLQAANPRQVAFLGHLMEKQGVQLIIDALPSILSAIPGTTLLVLGDGPFAARLKSQAERLGVDAAVEFLGFVQDHTEIESRLARSALAVATYMPDPLNFSRFADPMKIKTYLACGLPIVMTDVPQIARLVENKGAGCIVPYKADAVASAIIRYLSDPPTLERARTAAGQFAVDFQWDRIFDEAFARSMPFLG